MDCEHPSVKRRRGRRRRLAGSPCQRVVALERPNHENASAACPFPAFGLGSGAARLTEGSKALKSRTGSSSILRSDDGPVRERQEGTRASMRRHGSSEGSMR